MKKVPMVSLNTLKKLLWQPAARRRKPSAYGFSYGILLYRVIACAVPVLTLGVLVVMFASTPVNSLGFLVGFLIVYICLTLSIVTALGATRFKLGFPQALLIGYVVKAVLMGVALVMVPIPVALKNSWTLAGAVIGVVLWLGVEIATIKSARVLYFDPES